MRPRVMQERAEYVPPVNKACGPSYPQQQHPRMRDLPTDEEMEAMILAALQTNGAMPQHRIEKTIKRSGDHVERAICRLRRAHKIENRLGKWRIRGEGQGNGAGV